MQLQIHNPSAALNCWQL